MKNIALALMFFLALSCSDNDDNSNDILPNIPVNQTIFLNNPEFIALQTPGNWAYAQGGISGIIIYRSLGSSYIAFDRAAPHLAPQNCSQMIVNFPIMICPCDDSKFSILDGSPQTDGIFYAAKQYRVTVNGNTLQITNF